MIRSILIASTAVAVLALPAGASAANYLAISLKGVIASGVDTRGTFGEPSFDLSGLQYRFDALIDVENGLISSDHRRFNAGTVYGIPTAERGTLIVSNTIVDIVGRYSIRYELTDDGIHFFMGTQPYEHLERSIYFTDLKGRPDLPRTLEDDYQGTICDDGSCLGNFQLYDDSDNTSIFTAFSFGPSVLTVSGVDDLPELPAPVPEPSTWGMLILGLGLAGATLRSVASRQREILKQGG